MSDTSINEMIAESKGGGLPADYRVKESWFKRYYVWILVLGTRLRGVLFSPAGSIL